ncbi:MAG: EamA family transporter [Proteobacteria bacterium]|nr:EamA family transporter [Pseudomonadota bacterium]NIS68245.1 EamA family transporter [Pseudomonadota bacterium]
MTETEKIAGMVQAILAAFAYGWIGVFAKLAYQEGVGAIELLSYRFGLSALFLWVFSLIFERRTIFCKPSHLPVVLAMGVLGYATMSLSYFYALRFISASLAALILSLMPSTTTLLARFFFKEPFTLRKIFALLVTFTGACLIIGFQVGYIDWRGILCVLFAVFVSALYSIMGQRIMKTTPPETVNLYVITAAGLVFLFFHNPLSLFHGSPSWEAILITLLLIFVSTLPPMFLFLAAIEKIGSARTMMLGCGEPLMAVVAAYLVLGERLAPLQILGGTAIIAGFFLVRRI